MNASPSPKREFLREAVAQNTYAEVKRERQRAHDNPPERNRKGCGECYCCRTRNRFGCSRNADASMIQAVMAVAG